MIEIIALMELGSEFEYSQEELELVAEKMIRGEENPFNHPSKSVDATQSKTTQINKHLDKKMRSIAELCREAKWGKLTDKEIAYTVQRIKESKVGDDDDLPGLLYILGYSWAEEYRDLVEKFLYYRTDTLTCQQALKTLCTCWVLTDDYLDAVKMYIRGADWDDCDEVRMTAMNIAGEYLRKKKFDRELLHLLIQVFEDLGNSKTINESRDYARAFIKSCAYEAIARSMGKSHDDIPPTDAIEEWIETGQLSLLDQEMLQMARKLIQDK